MLRIAIPAAAAAMLALFAAPAAALEAPAGRTVLVVSGAISNFNAGQTAEFDLAMLEALPGREATMETPWTEGATSFSGPYLKAILEAVGARGSKLKVTALNDYSAEMPFEDATQSETILALEMNGKHLSVRDKGPAFVIYPFDRNPELYNEKYFARSVWQVRAIEVVE